MPNDPRRGFMEGGREALEASGNQGSHKLVHVKIQGMMHCIQPLYPIGSMGLIYLPT